MDRLRRDLEQVGAEQQICVGRSTKPVLSFHAPDAGRTDVPKRITDNKECNVNLVGVLQNLIRLHLHHFPSRQDHRTAVELLLHGCLSTKLFRRQFTHQSLLGDHENTGVPFEVDTLTSLDSLHSKSAPNLSFPFTYLKALDSNILLVAETKANHVEHFQMLASLQDRL